MRVYEAVAETLSHLAVDTAFGLVGREPREEIEEPAPAQAYLEREPG
jgi:hypothetical protein